jgi:hypothetical protein
LRLGLNRATEEAAEKSRAGLLYVFVAHRLTARGKTVKWGPALDDTSLSPG